MESRLRYVIEKEGFVDRVSDGAVRAILTLSGGDMRKVLNVLQVCNSSHRASKLRPRWRPFVCVQAAVSGYDTVEEETIYSVTGNPRPAEVRSAIDQLFSGEFKATYDCKSGAFFSPLTSKMIFLPCSARFADIQQLLVSGYALGDLVTEIARYMTTTAIDPDVRGHLIEKLSDIEYRLSFGTSEKLQGSALVGAFAQAREMLQSRKPRA